MKIICTQQNLNKGILICDRLIGKNFTLPILQNILLSCEKNKGFIKLSSTDLEMGIEVEIPAKIEEEGSVAIPAKLFINFIKNLPEGKIEIDSKNQQTLIRCSNYKSMIKSESAKEFPLIPSIKGGDSFTIKSSDFSNGISSVINAVSTFNVKPELSGVCVQFNENNMCFVGTDSFRLSEKKIFTNKKNDYINQIIIPRKTCDILIKTFENTDETLKFQIEKNQIIIQNKSQEVLMPKLKIVSRIIDGEYPNYEQIIPTTFLTSIDVSRDEIAHHIKTASIFSSKINDVVLKVDPKKQEISILSKDQDFGDHSSQISCKVQGEERELIFNFIYLLDGINAIPSSEISIKLNRETNPVLISSSEMKDFKYVLMPIKV